MKIEDFHLLKLIWCLLGLVLPIRSNCTFRKEWSGKWFQSGLERPMEVNTTHIGDRVCLETDGQDRFLMEDRSSNCYHCMVMHEKHYNVLQYKETYCMNKESLDSLCEKITGDALLYSMFRTDAKPVQCPFKGGPPFTFTYNRGSGECKSPVSKSDSCTDDSRMLLRYQACPDVHNSESTVEELTCLASWRDGSMRYMVGKLEHKMTSTDEDRYRCFVWSSSSDNRIYDVAQSGDATCNGLPSATEGSRTMRLTQVDSSHHESADCKFPYWVTDHHTWHLLDHSKTYHFSSHNGTMKVMSSADGETLLEMRAVCNAILASSESQAMISAHITIGCESGYRCMSFYRRDGHVIEMQLSSKEVQNSEEACSNQNYNPQMLPLITLVTSLPKRRRCPFLGRYTISNNNVPWKIAASTDQIRGQPQEEKVSCENGKQILSLGCNNAETMEIHSECNSDITATYSCHGYWMDGNGTNYLIALPQSTLPQSRSTNNKHCFVIYNMPDGPGNADRSRKPRHLQLYSLTKSCRPDLHIENGDPYWMFNITHHADCDGLVNGAHQLQQSHISVLLSLGIVITISALVVQQISR